IKQVLAIRAWWSEKVVEWVVAGRIGLRPDLPAPGFKWNETPRLNTSIALAASEQDFAGVRARLVKAYEHVMALIDELDDRELLEAGVFAWAGKWPVSRWLSINTARQYKTAGDYIRRARRSA
ncbi:MAG: ClbS/DfsB family four-helix bundle protein, partial [Rhodothermales bacterium]|nr:ClbS/DfsB family four-helix bundle protein [Rhodothermales bacterium]